MKFIYENDKSNDICVLNLFFPITLEVEKDNLGIGNLALSMLLKGSRKYESKDIAFELESNAISIEFSRTLNYLSVSLAFEKASIDKASSIFKDIFFAPSFQSSELDKLKLENINAIKARYDNIFNVCKDEFVKNIYEVDDYKSFSTLGTEESIVNLKRDDLFDFHRNYLLKYEPIVSFIGDIKKEEIKRNFLENFGRINSCLEDYVCEYKNFEESINIELKKDFNQAYVILGFKIPDIRSADFLKIKLINDYLGGGMSSVFFDKIREQMGLVYEISSSLTAYADTNFWMIYLGLDKSNLEVALKSIDYEMQDFVKNKISEDQLFILKQRVKSNEIFKMQKKAVRAFLLGLYEVLGLGAGYSQKSLEKLEAITKEDLDRVIDDVFCDRKFVTVVVK